MVKEIDQPNQEIRNVLIYQVVLCFRKSVIQHFLFLNKLPTRQGGNLPVIVVLDNKS